MICCSLLQSATKKSRRWFLMGSLFSLMNSCRSASENTHQKWVVGIISYEQDEQILVRFAEFDRYLAERTKTRIELEPVFSETKALERIQHQAWSLVFAPPGIAAIAIRQSQYAALFPLQATAEVRSLLVVRTESSIQTLQAVTGQTVALGQPGSATGYYLPLYNLYGLTLAQILFLPTPQQILGAIAHGEAAVGAVSLAEFNQYRSQFRSVSFRVLYQDPHPVPPGSLLLAPQIEQRHQEALHQILREASPELVQSVGYLPNDPIPDYQYMMAVVERVGSIATDLQERPARLF